MTTLEQLGKKRILVVSDIHGQCDRFVNLLNIAKYNPKEDQLVVLGDLVDRGDQNFETLCFVAYLQKQGAIIIKGNHDELCKGSIIELLNNNVGNACDDHILCGGPNTFNELKVLSKDELLQLYSFLHRLPLYYEIDNYIFVHAGVNAHIPLELNENNTLLWARDEFIYSPAYKGKVVVFGHTVTCTIPSLDLRKKILWQDIGVWFDIKNKDKIGIDCGGVFGGRQACLELPSRKVYYV